MTAILLLLTGLLVPLGQEDGAGRKIAVVDVPAVSEQYQKTADLEAHFEAIRRRLSEQRDALRDGVELTQRSLQEELKPGTKEFQARRKKLALQEAELKFFMESEARNIEADLAKSLKGIFTDIRDMVETVAKEKGIDIVMSADRMPADSPESPTQVRQQILLNKLLYWSSQVDLTAEIVDRLNVKYKSEGGEVSPG